MGTQMSLVMELDQAASDMLLAVVVKINSVTATTLLVVVATVMMLESDVHVSEMEEGKGNR